MSSSPLRTLIVMRHAKAETAAPSDHERPLEERGVEDAAAAGRWLAGEGLTPDVALVSGATRTRETYAAVADGARWEIEPTLEEGLYSAGFDSALDLVRMTDDQARTVLVIGHNPTMATLAQLLDDGEGEAGASAELMGDFPTSALAVFEYAGSWADLAAGSARVRAHHVGRA